MPTCSSCHCTVSGLWEPLEMQWLSYLLSFHRSIAPICLTAFRRYNLDIPMVEGNQPAPNCTFPLSLLCLLFLILKGIKILPTKRLGNLEVYLSLLLYLMTHLGSTSSSVACWPWFISCIYTPFSLNFVNALIQGLFTLCLLTGFFLFFLYSKLNTLAMFVFLKEIPLIWPLLFIDSQFISTCLVSRGLRSSFIVRAF